MQGDVRKGDVGVPVKCRLPVILLQNVNTVAMIRRFAQICIGLLSSNNKKKIHPLNFWWWPLNSLSSTWGQNTLKTLGSFRLFYLETERSAVYSPDSLVLCFSRSVAPCIWCLEAQVRCYRYIPYRLCEHSSCLTEFLKSVQTLLIKT